jgi:hypothetical protein
MTALHKFVAGKFNEIHRITVLQDFLEMPQWQDLAKTQRASTSRTLTHKSQEVLR